MNVGFGKFSLACDSVIPSLETILNLFDLKLSHVMYFKLIVARNYPLTIKMSLDKLFPNANSPK